MSVKPVLEPGPGHPITIEPNPSRIVVTVAGRVVADTVRALRLQEAKYPPVDYIPIEDVDQTLLERTDHSSYCPFKGDAGYFSIPLGGEQSINAIWIYENPHDAVAPIKNHVAFYPHRVESITEHQASPVR
jgi:uncharacterized protein (DUF427 family)